MTVLRKTLCSIFGVAGAIAIATCAAHAQQSQNVPNAFQGFNQNRDKPIQIKAQTFEVRDRDRKATFSGNVHVVQGEATIRCRMLVVTYVSEEAGAAGAAGAAGTAATASRASQPGAPGKSQISKLEAIGSVIVTQKEQTATGDSGLFDVRANIVTLTGNVVVSQGGNVMRGERLVVDLNSGVSRVESGKSRGQVEMSIPQSSKKDDGKPGSLLAPPKPDLLRPGQPN